MRCSQQVAVIEVDVDINNRDTDKIKMHDDHR